MSDGSPMQNDADEARSAARYDTTWRRRIAGQWYDVDDVPDLSDVED